MKKLLVTLIVSLVFSGSIFAQHPETHWPGFDYHAFELQGALYASLMIDGEPVTFTTENRDQMEVAAFVGDELRMTAMFLTDEYEEYDLFPTINAEPIYYTTPGEVVTFKMYNHATGVEYDVCEPVIWDGDPITILTGEEHWEGFDDPDHPLMLNFISPTPHYWADPETWNGEVPAQNEDVTLETNVIIGAGTTVHAGNVDLNGFTLTMEPGAEFYHTNNIDMTIQMQNDAYPAANRDGVGGFHLIASPINESVSIASTGLVSDEFIYDLFYFDQVGDEMGNEWINYNQGAGADPGFTELYIKKGYLYASEDTIQAQFTGNTISTDEEVVVELANVEGARFQGWNLVGNPFTCKADIADEWGSTYYYALNEAGDEIYTGDVAEGIAPMGAVFIDANEVIGATYFFKYGGVGNKKPQALSMTVTRERGSVIDRATLRFDNGSGMRKFQLNPNHTKVYMAQDGQDYAVLRAPEMGEMPVSFKAENNGTYTLNFTSQEVSFNYLHLIDNMTGADVNLLQTPVYTFNAQTTDYASRFKLVFATGNNSNEDSFAFFSNGNFIINNDGEAMLQVVDVMGRILKSETINGSASVNVNAAPGVYMLRLINGDNMKVQKVVVK